MVFSFFKKKDQADDLPKQPSIKLPAGQLPVKAEPAAPSEETIFGDSMSFAPAKIEVFEVSEGLEPVVEEAAMLYANDQLAAAVSVLTGYLSGHPSQNCDEPWLMLFELYQQQVAKHDYDELAMQFVLKFERTAPVWRDNTIQALSNVTTPISAKSNYFSFVAQIETGNNKISELAAAAKKGEKIRLDFSKFDAIQPEACHALQQALQACRKAKTPVQFVAGTRLTDWLHAHIEMMRREDREIPFWLLLLEVYQALGEQDTFENLAVDYAVTYEVSPPSWETPVLAQADTDDEIEEPAPDTVAVVTDVCILRGVITDQSADQLQKLMQFADCHKTVQVDIRELDRIDFVSAGNLLNILVNFAQQGKPVIFDGVSALIYPLFRIMGISDMATVNRRK